MLERLFKLRENGATARREVAAGLTTFAAMAYILAVNPVILANAGMPAEALLTATAVSAAVATLIMAALTNFPLALAPGMGINAFFALSICVGMGVPWPSALGLVFVNGVIFLLLSVTGVRERLVNAIPPALKVAVTAGIGFFIALIGLQSGGLVVADPVTMVKMGDLARPATGFFFAGLLLTAALMVRRVPGAILLAILGLTLIGLVVPDGQGGTLTKLPASLVSAPASLEPLAFRLDFDLFVQNPLRAIILTLTLLLVDLFDNLGSLIAVTRRAGLVGADGRIPRVGRALTADSLAAILSSLVGTSTVVTYIESATGVQAGGRTGLTAVVTALCFLAALVFTPVLLAVPAVAVAPALVMVGVFMFEAVTDLDPRDFGDFAPAVLTIVMMPLAFSISTGIGVGVLALVVLALATGRRDRLTPWLLGLAAVFLAHFLEAPLLAALR